MLLSSKIKMLETDTLQIESSSEKEYRKAADVAREF